MTAPTPAEVRQAVADAWIEPGGTSSGPRDDIESALFALVSEAERGLWNVDDFRPSEETDNEAAVDAIIERLRPIIAEEFGRSLLAFARVHPDAPRADRAKVPANVVAIMDGAMELARLR